MDLVEHLRARGLVQDCTHPEELSKLLGAGPVTFYIGFDPSGPSLHAGSLVPLVIMTWFARAGHVPLALVGGATGMIGDPSGKSEERQLLVGDTLRANLAALEKQIRGIVPTARIVNNADWTAPLSILDFLRDIGKHVSVNAMLAKESVKQRLENREQGISFTEFSYMLLQAFDFSHLALHQGCRLQMGGSDQWGNITLGIDLTRRLGGPEVYGLVTPLLMTAQGTKFGKTAAGTSVWLDPNMTSPYRFYQFWLNAEDADVERYLKMFTFLPLEELDALLGQHRERPEKRVAQTRLAEEVTRWLHGDDGLRRARAASQVMFGGALDSLTDADLAPLAADVPSTEIPRAELAAGLKLVDLLERTKLAASKGAARRLLSGGGVYLNNVRQDDAERTVTVADLATESMLVLRSGKKTYHLVKVVS